MNAPWLQACGWSAARPPRALVFVAHPDDETIGLGGHLATLRDPLIVHATDGAPRNLNDARAQGFADASAYARARRAELEQAVSLVGVAPERLLCLDAPDQEAQRRLIELTNAFAEIVARETPDMVFTHAFEGGHPDHDAVALVARAALARMSGRPLLIEMPFYHSRSGVPVRQSFALGGPTPVVVPLAAPARARKLLMYEAHASQRETLRLFHAESESFRRAAPVEFSKAPNGGEIFYESFGWGLTGAAFAAEACGALARMGLPSYL